jgi:hypothetical protein
MKWEFRKEDIHRTLLELKRDLGLLEKIEWREFEHVVAELFAGFGWEVSLTPITRDEGYDLFGITKDPSGLETSWIVEIKKRGRQRIGADVLQHLHGTKSRLDVPNAVLVTTSIFTDQAFQFGEAHGIQLVDRNRLHQWIQNYRPPSEHDIHLSRRLFHSCFISYSHKDEAFAVKLSARLRLEGIKVWFAPEDIQAGRKIHEQIQRAISLYDKMIIVLSPKSMKSEWVKAELRGARRREVKEKRQILFPVTLAPFEQVAQWECFDADVGKDIAVELREYFIPDFSNWHDDRSFESQAKKVVDGLRSAA